MSIPYAVTDVDINRVSKSFVQSNLGDFAISTMPKALCLDRFTGRSNKTDYDLASLSNALLEGTNLRDWSPGIDPPTRGINANVIARPDNSKVKISIIFRSMFTSIIGHTCC